jgi:hypothetical protein
MSDNDNDEVQGSRKGEKLADLLKCRSRHRGEVRLKIMRFLSY